MDIFNKFDYFYEKKKLVIEIPKKKLKLKLIRNSH